jgi:hypothetical protein
MDYTFSIPSTAINRYWMIRDVETIFINQKIWLTSHQNNMVEFCYLFIWGLEGHCLNGCGIGKGLRKMGKGWKKRGAGRFYVGISIKVNLQTRAQVVERNSICGSGKLRVVNVCQSSVQHPQFWATLTICECNFALLGHPCNTVTLWIGFMDFSIMSHCAVSFI